MSRPKTNKCPLGLPVGGGVKCRWYLHGTVIPDEYDVVMANPERHHTFYAVLVEEERDVKRGTPTRFRRRARS